MVGKCEETARKKGPQVGISMSSKAAAPCPPPARPLPAPLTYPGRCEAAPAPISASSPPALAAPRKLHPRGPASLAGQEPSSPAGDRAWRRSRAVAGRCRLTTAGILEESSAELQAAPVSPGRRGLQAPFGAAPGYLHRQPVRRRVLHSARYAD